VTKAGIMRLTAAVIAAATLIDVAAARTDASLSVLIAQATPTPCASVSSAPVAVPTNLPTEPPVSSLSTEPPVSSLPTEPPQDALQSAPPVTLPSASPLPSSVPCPGTNVESSIYNNSQIFYGQPTCGLHGAPGDEACMAAVNQVLINAGVAPLGPGQGFNYIPDAISWGLAHGRLQEIPQAATAPGDLEVRHSADDTYASSGGDEHIGICQTYGCTTVLSNHSSSCNFSWYSDPTMCYNGSPYCGGYSNYYRVLS
jgi:hypothetical protein